MRGIRPAFIWESLGSGKNLAFQANRERILNINLKLLAFMEVMSTILLPGLSLSANKKAIYMMI
jgi:hypothetical protein